MKKAIISAAMGVSIALLPVAKGQATPPVYAKVECRCENNGASAPAFFSVHNGTAEIANGPCAGQFTVPAGSYEMSVTLDGAVDAPKRVVKLQADGQRVAKVLVQFETGELLVDVTRDGRRSVGVVRISRDGEAVANVGAGAANHLSVGTYAVSVESRGETRQLGTVNVVRGERVVLVIDFSENAPGASQ